MNIHHVCDGEPEVSCNKCLLRRERAENAKLRVEVEALKDDKALLTGQLQQSRKHVADANIQVDVLTKAGDWMSLKLDKIAAAARSVAGAALLEALAMEPPTIKKGIARGAKCGGCNGDADAAHHCYGSSGPCSCDQCN